MLKRIIVIMMAIALIADLPIAACADADETDNPVVFAHGLLGFDDFLFLNYRGDDYGTFVGDPCDGFWEVMCNKQIDDALQRWDELDRIRDKRWETGAAYMLERDRFHEAPYKKTPLVFAGI